MQDNEEEPQGFLSSYIRRVEKYWPERSYLVLKSTPRVPIEIPLMTIGYKYNSRKVLGFIATEGGRITESGDPYLSRFPDIYF